MPGGGEGFDGGSREEAGEDFATLLGLGPDATLPYLEFFATPLGPDATLPDEEDREDFATLLGLGQDATLLGLGPDATLPYLEFFATSPQLFVPYGSVASSEEARQQLVASSGVVETPVTAYSQYPESPSVQAAYSQCPESPSVQAAYSQYPESPSVQAAYSQYPESPSVQSDTALTSDDGDDSDDSNYSDEIKTARSGRARANKRPARNTRPARKKRPRPAATSFSKRERPNHNQNEKKRRGELNSAYQILKEELLRGELDSRVRRSLQKSRSGLDKVVKLAKKTIEVLTAEQSTLIREKEALKEKNNRLIEAKARNTLGLGPDPNVVATSPQLFVPYGGGVGVASSEEATQQLVASLGVEDMAAAYSQYPESPSVQSDTAPTSDDNDEDEIEMAGHRARVNAKQGKKKPRQLPKGDKRAQANSFERLRCESLRADFNKLGTECGLAALGRRGSSKLQILNKAVETIGDLKAEEQRLMKEKERLIEKVARKNTPGLG